MSTASELIQHCTDAPPSPSTSGTTLYMDVVLDVRRLSFEFPPGGTAPAVLVGSLRSAEIAIDDARVAPLEFHFERVGQRIYVVPAYGANITVDSVPLQRQHPIRKRANIAFSGHVLSVEVAARRDPGDCTTLVQRPRFLPWRTHSETPFSKRARLKRDTLTSQTAALELSEILAIKAAGERRPRRHRLPPSPLVIALTALFGWLLGYTAATWLPNVWALL